jgi:DNA-binding transcriptional MerR regulator
MPAPMAEDTAEYTIDQLAQETGMSARNIRAHQSRGLLEPPKLRGRTGYYTEHHAARVKLIQRLQSDGFSLALIQRLLRAAGDSTDGLLRLARALHGPFGTPDTRLVELRELSERFHSRSAEVTGQLESLGVLRTREDGMVEEVTPLVFRGGEVFADLGVPAEALVEVGVEVRKHMDAIATACLRLFLDYVWQPFEERGQPEQGLEKVLDTVEVLRGVASGAMGSIFQIAMGEVLEKRFGSELRRLESQRHA